VWQARIDAADRRGQQALGELVAKACPDGCGETVGRLAATPAGNGDPPGDESLTAHIKDVGGRAAAATGTAGRWWLPVLAALAAMALVPAGLFPRIDEYR
jgi:hypothetical protein